MRGQLFPKYSKLTFGSKPGILVLKICAELYISILLFKTMFLVNN